MIWGGGHNRSAKKLKKLQITRTTYEMFTLHFLFLFILMKNVAAYIRPSTNHSSIQNGWIKANII